MESASRTDVITFFIVVTRKIALHYDEKLVREAARSFWRRTVGDMFLRVLLMFTLAYGAAILMRVHLWMGDVVLSVLVLAYALIIVLYRVHVGNALKKFRKMKAPDAQLSMADETFTLSSDLGVTTLPWSSVTEIWKFERFWLMLFSPSQFATLPMNNFSQEDREILLSHIKKAGGKDR